ncbi:MAG TPA: hypothetical protein VFU98_11440 [Microlunatus sp.]|nr:hypothetical protein [Microlunatus sp.]
MRVDIKQGGDGMACWNAEAITAYAAAADAREAALGTANPDLVITPGLIKCYGCEELEFDMGTRCTAELTRTLYAVADEVAPRPSDAAGSLADIPGLRPRIESETAVDQVPEIYEAAPYEPARRTGLRGLLGRRG